jgi:tetratricopeptide (TPR) repeat protein
LEVADRRRTDSFPQPPSLQRKSLKSAQQVEMLCKLPDVKKCLPKAGFLTILFLNISLLGWTPAAKAQAQLPTAEQTGGKISGTVLLKKGNRPASQVAVKLKSHAAGIFRSVLTDLEGHFEVRSLPPSTYEIVVDEPGYEPAQASAQLDGSNSPLVLYLNSPSTTQTVSNGYTVSARELRIPGKARNEYVKGLGSLTKKDYAASLSHFAKAAQAFPEYYEAYYHAGVAETTLGHLDEAMQAFQKAIDLSGGKYAWAEFGIGYLFYMQGKTEEAITVLHRGLEKDEGSADGYFILGLALLRLNRLDEAERSAREALLRNANFADAYLVLADVSGRRREYREQLQGLDTYLKLAPNGAESANVREAREIVLRMLAQLHPEN